MTGTDVPSGARTVLVVDDEPSVVRVAVLALQKWGFKTLQASRGSDALLVACEHQGPIDLLITDVVMPEMGGRELSERFREQRPGAVVLFMSGYTGDEVLLQGVRVAEVDFIAKPFTLEALRKKVEEVLSRRMDFA